MVAASTVRPGSPRAVAVVPARLGSTRLPRKMLLDETGSPLFEHTVANARRSGVFERVVLATDSDEIAAAAAAAGVEVVTTSKAHPSGTDRVHEAYERLEREHGAWDVVVNVQGDEPELPAAGFRALVALFRDPAVELATLFCDAEDPRIGADPDVVKVVVDEGGDALYFSRACVPFRRDPRHGEAAAGLRRHVGVYGFRPEALRAFCALPPGRLERTERLEQLRWLEAGRRIRCAPTPAHPSGIDTPEQYAAFKARISARRTLERESTS